MTVANYIVKRFAALGIDCAFGVPGDYAFPLDDAIESNLKWVGCVNELGAAYAADGYARVRGASLLCVTYGVGELSALNGIMGAKSHRLPVFVLVGTVSRRIVNQRLVTKHTLGNDHFYDMFDPILEAATCVKAVITPDNCVSELERAITLALKFSAPAYIAVPHDVGSKLILEDPLVGKHLSQIKRQLSDKQELEGALQAIVNRFKVCKKPIVIPTSLVARYGLTDKVTKFLAATNIAWVTTYMDKGFLDESSSLYIGNYFGIQSEPREVSKALEQDADVILDLGGLVMEDVNTGFWTDKIPEEKIIVVHDNWVQVGDKVYVNVAMEDVVLGLTTRLGKFSGNVFGAKPQVVPMDKSAGTDKFSSDAFFPRLQRWLKANDVVVIEAGSCEMVLNSWKLPTTVTSHAQTLWSSIGWGTPATLGICFAAPKQRVVLVTGDGAHHMTMGDVASMGKHAVKPIIFLMNNGAYGCEITLSEPGHDYNLLPAVRYAKLAETFGCKGWLSKTVTTVKELEETFELLETHDGGAYIELMTPISECQPLPAAILDQMYKTEVPKP